MEVKVKDTNMAEETQDIWSLHSQLWASIELEYLDLYMVPHDSKDYANEINCSLGKPNAKVRGLPCLKKSEGAEGVPYDWISAVCQNDTIL